MTIADALALGHGLDTVLQPVLAELAALSPGQAPHVRIREAVPGRPSAWPTWVPGELVEAFAATGVAHPWSHQAQAMDLVRRGQHTVVSTGPSSGKTLCYAAPALTSALDGGTTLYLSPTTALASDQAERLSAWAPDRVPVMALDGDSPVELRRWARDHARVVLTTPDLIHHSMLPGHERWASFLRRLRLIVVDECHTYRGVFGAHVAAILRRVVRLAALRGARPVFVVCSATAAQPGAFAEILCGQGFTVVDDDGSPHPGSATVVHVPGEASSGDSADLLAGLVARQLQTAAFGTSRSGVEALARRARRRLERTGVELGPDTVVSYRGGHLRAERRAVEAGLRSRSVLGVATTSALEVGVDVSGLDAVVMDGWPGSVTSLQQRAGRAGRGDRPGVAVLVTGSDPIDAHLAANPDAMLSRPVEAGVTDPDNPYVLAPHLALAAMESPLTPADLDAFGPSAPGVVAALTQRGDMRHRPGGWFWVRGEAPSVDIRAAVGKPVTLVETGTGRVLGTVDEARALEVAHPGAVYLHRVDTYVVDSLHLDEGVAMLHAADPGWVTVPKRRRSVVHTCVDTERPLGDGVVTFGTVDVQARVTGFTRRHALTGAVLGEERLDLPERSFATRAVWWRPGDPQVADAAVHAAEHVLVAMLPLVVPCDRWDVGAHANGTTSAKHAAVTVYDVWPGGAGFAERAFTAAPAWFDAARARLRDCRCAAGCPSCVVQVGCDRRNAGLDKAAAARLLG